VIKTREHNIIDFFRGHSSFYLRKTTISYPATSI